MRWILMMASLWQAVSAEQLVLRGAQVVDVETGRVKRQDLKIGKGKARVVEAGGKYVIPGLWDGHFHTVRPETAGQARRVLGTLVAHGVTQVRDMGSVPEAVVGLREQVRKGEVVGPELYVAGVMIDGPPSKGDATMAVVGTVEEARAVVDRMAALGVDFVKVQQNVKAEVYQALVGRAKEKGLAVHGHTPDAISVREAARAGQRTVEHLTGVLVACAGREGEIREAVAKGARGVDFGPLGPAGQAMMESFEGAKLAALGEELRGVTMVPTLVWEKGFIFHPGAEKRRRPETDALMKAQWRKALEVVGALARGGVTVVAGTDGGDEFTRPGVGVHEELELLVEAGLTPLEALRAGTRNGWRMMGKAGGGENFVVLSANPLADIRNTRRVEGVVLRGRWLDRAALKGLMEGR